MANSEEKPNLEELLDRYTDQEQMYNFEGSRGVKRFEQLVSVLGYDSSFGGHLVNFFEDNSGAIEAVIKWMGRMNIPEWRAAIENELIEEEEDDDLDPDEDEDEDV